MERPIILGTVTLTLLVAPSCNRYDRSSEAPGAPDGVVAAYEPMEREPRVDAELDESDELGASESERSSTSETESDGALGVVIVEVEPVIVSTCEGLEGNKAFFEFDSANVEPEFRDRLHKIADCMTEGALRGKDLLVVGTADQTGTAEYNWELGGRRAASVAEVLRQEGVRDDRISTMSLGEFTAPPPEISNPPYERRVVIRIDPAPSS